DINEAWLITGEGNMLKEANNFQKIPLFNISLEDFNTNWNEMPVAHELEIPILAGSDFAIVNEGEAMSPEIEHASVVFLKEVDVPSAIFGDIYLVVSEHIKVIREVRGRDENHWKLAARHTSMYDDIISQKSSIKAVYKVKGVITIVTI